MAVYLVTKLSLVSLVTAVEQEGQLYIHCCIINLHLESASNCNDLQILPVTTTISSFEVMMISSSRKSDCMS
jgi:hypothetical protein